MANNEIKLLKTTDLISESVEKINSNFKALQYSMSLGSSGIANYMNQIEARLDELQSNCNSLIEAKFEELELRIQNLESLGIANYMNQIEAKFEELELRIQNLESRNV